MTQVRWVCVPRADIEHIVGMEARRRVGGPDPGDLNDLDDGLAEAIQIAARHLEASEKLSEVSASSGRALDALLANWGSGNAPAFHNWAVEYGPALIAEIGRVATERDAVMAECQRLEQELTAARSRSDGVMEAAEATGDYFGGLVNRARQAAAKASIKFPQPNYVTLKIAEEAGEVVRGAVHYAEGRMGWDEVESEIVQLLAMLIRFVTEGDQVNGVTPPAAVIAARRAGGGTDAP